MPDQPTDQNDASWMTDDAAQKHSMAEFLADGTAAWLTLYCSVHAADGGGTSRYAILSQPSDREKILAASSWDVSPGGTRPGFVTSWTDETEQVTYVCAYDHDGMEPIVHLRELEGPYRPLPELAEDFRLFHNIFAKGVPTRLYTYDDAANEEVAAEITENEVRVRMSLIRRYLAARQLDLVLLHVSDVTAVAGSARDPFWKRQTREWHLEYWRTDLLDTVGSRLQGKRVIAAPPIEESGVWPYEQADEFESFVIATDKNGAAVSSTCDPSGLANNFGSNAGAPNYLTPVYFRSDVLAKYYADTGRYSVEDGHLRCSGSWGIQIDNDQTGYIVAFLGDLGRDLPHSEQVYWRSHNVEPQGPMSSTAIARSFMGEFADPVSPDLRFKFAYSACNESWTGRFGWPLFKPLHEDDAHVLAGLHIPLTETQAEFDTQMTYLTKLMVDSLNEEELDNRLTKIADEKGIAKLHRLLDQTGFTGSAAAAQYLRNIYGARSKGAAHRKGSDYDVTRIIGSADRCTGFADLLEQGVQMLESLTEFAEEKKL